MISSVLTKSFALIETLSETDEPQSLGSLAEQVNLNKVTVHRILNDLVALGYVTRVHTGRYALSTKLRRLAIGQDDGNFMKIAEPLLRELWTETNETVNLATLRQDRVVYLLVFESTQPLRRVVEPGAVDPFHSTALGRAIVSRLPEAGWSRLLRWAHLEQRTPRTVTDRGELRRILGEVRDQGYSVEREENDIGVVCFGAAVTDRTGVVGAVSITVPAARLNDAREAELIRAVQSVADRVSRVLTDGGALDVAIAVDHD